MTPRATRRLTALALASLAVGMVASCYLGGSSPSEADAGGCPSDLPAGCPGTAPSYSQKVAPVIASRCATCHGPGGTEPNHDFTTYDGVFAERATILTQVYSCAMPLAGSPQLAAGEREAVLAWLVCGAPNQ